MGSTERFGYEWTKFQQITPDYEKQFLKWVTPLKPADFKSKAVLDAGCGTGRNSYWPLIYNASKVCAFDFDKHTVQVAKKNLSKFKNAKVEYMSIYNIKYTNTFDIALCIGVLHHLENPKLAIKNLIKATKKGGRVVVWVYGYNGNSWIVKLVNPLRDLTSQLPLPITNLLTYFLSIPFVIFLKLFPQKKPYLKQLKGFKFWHIHSIILDQLIPKIANYWKKEQVLELFKGTGVKEIKIYPVNGMSWSLVAKKV